MTFCEVKPFLQLDQNDVSDKSPPKLQSLSLELSSIESHFDRSLGQVARPARVKMVKVEAQCLVVSGASA